MRDVLTPEQVAEHLQLNKDTVYRLIRSHKLAATRIGRAYRVPREDLEAFLRRNSTAVQMQQAAWTRLLAIGAAHPDVDGDALLDELEAADAERAIERDPA